MSYFFLTSRIVLYNIHETRCLYVNIIKSSKCIKHNNRSSCPLILITCIFWRCLLNAELMFVSIATPVKTFPKEAWLGRDQKAFDRVWLDFFINHHLSCCKTTNWAILTIPLHFLSVVLYLKVLIFCYFLPFQKFERDQINTILLGFLCYLCFAFILMLLPFCTGKSIMKSLLCLNSLLKV